LSLFECTTVVLRFLGRKFFAWNTVSCNMKRTYKILLSPLTLSKVHLVSNIYLIQGLYQMGCIEQKKSCIPIECILTKVGIQNFFLKSNYFMSNPLFFFYKYTCVRTEFWTIKSESLPLPWPILYMPPISDEPMALLLVVIV
jgi:hypothetical protein